MNSVTVTFTQEELNAISALLDMAVKAQGLQAARAALVIMGKLEHAVQVANGEAPGANPAPIETGEGAA